ncbi:putative ribonuclease H protein [Vitis vinifera]|uniref:Putative ribonuclease H protein n=1 Tax=Vitis vinifera TaxID=29760 RepID=A0A438JWQ9_VITVI|nr:putative ribonuclease H protein [Vitis vinifera]
MSSVSYAILVNGNAKGWVKASRSLRQGDSLSPFLFTIVVDVLNRMMLKVKERSVLEGFRADRNRIRVNLDKSNLFGISLDQNHLSRLALLLECKASDWPILYLGLPLGGNPIACGFWDPIPASVAAKIERLQRDFLWSGVGKGKRYHLVSWDAVCKPRVKGGLGFGKIPLRNRAHLGKWLWKSPRESTALWHQKAIAQVFRDFSKYTRFVVGDGERIRFWEDLWWGDQIFKVQYPRLFRVVTNNNIPISSILGSDHPFSWNFNFRRNLSDSEIEDLERLFTVKSFFIALSQMPDLSPFFPTKFVWNSQVPFKVKVFIWLVAHKKQGELADHLFLHCFVSSGLWHKLFQLAKMDWVPPRSISDMMSINYKGRNARIFEDKARNSESLWDCTHFLASLWAFCFAVFKGIPLNVIQLDWLAMCSSNGTI